MTFHAKSEMLHHFIRRSTLMARPALGVDTFEAVNGGRRRLRGVLERRVYRRHTGMLELVNEIKHLQSTHHRPLTR